MCAAAAVLAGCTGTEPEVAPTSSPPPSESPTSNATSTPTSTRTPTPTPTPAVFDPAAAFATVEQLATQIGPREAASAAFDEAVVYVISQFESIGYEVTTMPVPVPAGDSWGVPVAAGTSDNVIADPPGFDPVEPHVIVGAHLDTVAVAPGAEDNGSGVAVLLELARMAAGRPLAIPVRFIAFGAEEPRGRGDALHHFGSRQYVAALAAEQRAAVQAMVSLDRVGVPADAVPVSTGGTGPTVVLDELVAAAASAGIPASRDEQNRASDHWSFEKAGIPAARIGSVPYAAYHSADDLPEVVDADQLGRVGTIVWTWLASD
jgi:Zn-dependent M28 family amino/carboxypeptidase